ncbi:hypothetical protein A2U01_0090124, partial [Trifolium medium]|nr:hypothetical protein [Trifolium medium]
MGIPAGIAPFGDPKMRNFSPENEDGGESPAER